MASAAVASFPSPARSLPYEYGPPLDGIIQGLKYDGALANARVLGLLLGRSLVALHLHGQVDLLVPMPLHPARLVERGFNQSFEIARFVARTVRVPCEPVRSGPHPRHRLAGQADPRGA